MTLQTAETEPRRKDRRGSVLVLVLIMLFLLGAMVASMTSSMRGQALTTTMGRELTDSLLVADMGIARAKARLQWEFTTNWAASLVRLMTAGQTTSGWMTTPEGAAVDLECVEATATYMDFRLTSTSTGRRPRRVEMIVRIRFVLNSTPLTGSGAGAIVAFGPVDVGGNFTVDGRDHPADAADKTDVLPGSGAPGISSTSTVTMSSGSVTIGGTSSGTDYAPAKKSSASDGTHFDQGSLVWAPESGGNATDGLDNDGDGLVDETTGQPTSADEYFGQNAGGLKAAAQTSGTYFTDLTSYNAWLATAGNDPSGKILYIEVANGASVGQLDLPVNPAPASDPAIVVVAGADPTQHDTTVGPVHANNGTFQGVLIADRINHMNGNGMLLGQVVTFTDSTLGPSIGNGTFDVLFSSEVLGNLPNITNSAVPTNVVEDVQSWRELAPPANGIDTGL